MIKCNVTICGTVSKAAQVRNNKEGKPFTTFGVSVVLLNPNGINKTIEVSVITDGEINTADIVVGSKIEMKGELTFRKRVGFEISRCSILACNKCCRELRM